ncbi:unnamed protein product, partial [Lampetra fluviatilis]
VNGALGWCERHRNCNECLRPCKEFWELEVADCRRKCKRHPVCVPSCDFAASARDPRGSPCPPPRLSAGFGAACVPECRVDQHCGSSRRCCHDDCGGATCRATRHATRGTDAER